MSRPLIREALRSVSDVDRTRRPPKHKLAAMPDELWGEPLKLVTIARWTVERAKRIEPPAAIEELVVNVVAPAPRRVRPKRVYNDRPWMKRLRKVEARPPIMIENWRPGDDWKPDRHRHFGAWEGDRYNRTRGRFRAIADLRGLLADERFHRPLVRDNERRKADGS